MAIKLDNSLLDELGLGGLPEAEKKPFLRQLYEHLEKNVGTRLAAGMTDEQLNQFERFASGDINYAKTYLDGAKPGWTSLEDYASMYKTAQDRATKANSQFNEQAVVAEYAAFKWLEINFPNYKDVVAEEFEKLKAEIKQGAAEIVASTQGGDGNQADQAPPAATQSSFAPQQPQSAAPQQPESPQTPAA